MALVWKNMFIFFLFFYNKYLQNCGRSHENFNRIAEGSEAGQQEFPWMVGFSTKIFILQGVLENM